VLNTIYEDDAGMVERQEVGAVEPTPGVPGRQRSVGLPDPRKTKSGLFLAARVGRLRKVLIQACEYPAVGVREGLVRALEGGHGF
jgi:hypothetical protein